MVYRLKNDPTPSPPSASAGTPAKPVGRLASLDAFRGFIMIMLAAHGFGLAQLAQSKADSPLWKIANRDLVQRIAFHFEHPPWQSSFVPGSHDATAGLQWMHWGVSFWDLIQPAFIFMVGAAMPFSYARRKSRGQSQIRRTFHALIRSVALVLIGVALYSAGDASTDWNFTNVLAQIGLGYFFVYLILGLPQAVQWMALSVILIGTWAGMQTYQLPKDYNPSQVGASYARGEVYAPPYAQWSKNGNAFHSADVWFLNQFPRPANEGTFKHNNGGYQTLNFVPSMATMLLGAFCGQLMLSSIRPGRKLSYLILGAAICWGLGVVAGATCCPIVKRIWTPSWVLFSGGYVIAMLAVFYLLFDILPLKRLSFPLVVVGMNSLVVYLIGETQLHLWIVENVQRHFGGAIQSLLAWLAARLDLLAGLNVSPADAGATMYAAFAPVVNATAALLVIWLFAYWLYRQRIFVRL